MKRIIPIFLLVFVFLSGFQGFSQTVYYHYDDSGNRILRTITLGGLKSSETISDPGDSFNGFQDYESDSLTEILENHSISIFPNPTSGELMVEVSGDEIVKGKIMVVDLKGRVIISSYLKSGVNQINLTHEPEGIYFLRIYINDKRSDWKVIKQ